MFVTGAPQDALGQYGKRVEEARGLGKGTFPSFARREVSQVTKGEEIQTLPHARKTLLQELKKETPPCRSGAGNLPKTFLCRHCQLPVGQTAYVDEEGSGKGMVHAECLAQNMVSTMRAEEQERLQKQAELKKARRAEFDIGWEPELIPSNAIAAQKLGCAVVPTGMCCLVAGEDKSLHVAATLEPAAAVNLEYLSVALQVRRSEGREPLFSLDPVDNGKVEDEDPDASMQVKRFEPEWLAGTTVGEVMFQADYHLKELSFGEYEQPVVGMKSCFDLAEKDDDDDDWSAREWFVVRKAEVHTSEDQVLIPHLKMGVEAREQIMGDDGLEDAAITRPDHPLVRYADAFTHNFDLIAERKSVVFQLREVAKASIMAKYLLESAIALDDSWFSLAGEAKPVCCLEVPQLWNDRVFKNISVEKGVIAYGNRDKTHGLYGGVDFGIDRFRLSAPSRVATSVVAGRAVLGRPASTLMATSRTGLTMGPARQFARLSAPLSATMSMAASRAGLGVPKVAAGLSMGVPQGVDLNLDKFNLSAAMADGRWGSSVQAKDSDLNLGTSFWSGLAQGAALDDDCKSLLKKVFNRHLSDRRDEKEHFMPPPTCATYMQKLKDLVKSEQVVQQQRKEQFFSNDFVVDKAGPLFPPSWTSSFQLASDKLEAKALKLLPRPEYVAEGDLLRESLASSAPTFDKLTEDGTRFRIYRAGGLEARSVQEEGGEEAFGAVFSVGN